MPSSISEARRRLADGLRLLSDLDPVDQAALARFVRTAEAYARVEVAALGAIEYELPAHLGGGEAAPRVQGEQLAARERDLLGQTAEGQVDLASILEERGVKVIAAAVPSDLGGVFTYEAALGPAIFVNTAAGAGETRFWLAHAYAHFVADVDPYRVRVCRPGESRLVPAEAIDLDEWYASAADLSAEAIGASEERANAFAEAILLPASLLAAFVSGARRETGRPLSPDVMLQMESYFGASAARIAARLVHLGALPEEEAAVLAREAGARARFAASDAAAIDGDEAGVPRRCANSDEPGAPPVLPRRMVNLAVGAFHQSKITLDRLAEVLGSDREGVRELLRAYDVPNRRKERRS